MKKLIIAEKPHLARFVVSCLPQKLTACKAKGSQQVNWYEGDDYIVTNAYGHLFTAYDVEDYTKEEKPRWVIDNLPFFPPGNKFYFKLNQIKDPTTKKKKADPGIKLQFECIRMLIHRDDVGEIVHCGDADREGEIIVRHILTNAGTFNKPVKRLWFSEETKEAFDQSFHALKDDSFYDNWANEGDTRLKTDWMYGINLTRYLTLKSGGRSLFRAGRVLCAIVKEIYDRDTAIRDFVPEKFLTIVSEEETNGEKIKLKSKKTFKPEEQQAAEDRCAFLNGSEAVVTEVKTEDKVMPPGKLHSLTTLQTALNKKYGMSLADSMVAIQSVYEKGYITYPRTNTEYLGETEKDKAKKIINNFCNQGLDLKFRDSKTIFDDSKIDGHSALCPTYKIPTDLSGNEAKVYEEVKSRFCAVFCAKPCIMAKTIITIHCGDEDFALTGSILKQKGFLKYDPRNSKDKMLPDLKKGNVINVDFKPCEEFTKPPEHYNVTTFAAFLESPFRTEGMTEDEFYKQLIKGVEIGTVATRTAIIDNAIKSGYITVNKNQYLIAPAGEYLISLMEKLGIDMSKEKTVELSVILKKVNHGEMTQDEAIEKAKEDISAMFQGRDKSVDTWGQGGGGTIIGKCPLCGGDVTETPFGWTCANHNKEDKSSCPFVLFKENKFVQAVAGRKMTSGDIKSILSKKKLTLKATSKAGNKYDATFKIVVKDGWINFERDEQTADEESYTCPICGGKVRTTPFGAICENNKREDPSSCRFVLFYKDKYINMVSGKDISSAMMKEILSKGGTTMTLKKKDGSGTYKVRLSPVFDKDAGRMAWEKSFVND